MTSVVSTQEKNKHDTQFTSVVTPQSKIKTCVTHKLGKELQCRSCRNKRGANSCVFRQHGTSDTPQFDSFVVGQTSQQQETTKCKTKTCRARKLPQKEWCSSCRNEGVTVVCAYRLNYYNNPASPPKKRRRKTRDFYANFATPRVYRNIKTL